MELQIFFGVSLMKVQRGWYPTCIHYQCNLHQSHPSNKMRYPVYMIIYVSSTTESIWPYETLFGWLWWFWMCIPWTHIHTMACNIFFFLIRLGETHQISWFRLVVNHPMGMCQNHSKPFKTAFGGLGGIHLLTIFLGFFMPFEATASLRPPAVAADAPSQATAPPTPSTAPDSCTAEARHAVAWVQILRMRI